MKNTGMLLRLLLFSFCWARIALMGKVHPEVDTILRIGAAKTLGGSFDDMSGDDLFADLAYFDYNPGTVERLPFLGVDVAYYNYGNTLLSWRKFHRLRPQHLENPQF